VSWQCKTVEGALRVAGAVARRGDDTEAMERAVAKSRTKVKDPAPKPKLLKDDLVLTEEQLFGMRVFDLQLRSGASGQRVVYYHGGSYTFEIAAPHWWFLTHLARTIGARVSIAIYPLAPETTASTTVPICTDLAGQIIDASAPETVTVMGDSAGGGLALAVAQQLLARGKQPRQTILISPWLDVTMTDPGLAAVAPDDAMLNVAGLAHCGRLYAGELDVADPLASPLFGELDGLAPIEVYTGTHDILNVDAHNLVKRAEGRNVAVALHEAPGMLHVHPLLAFIPEGKRARDQIVANVRSA
jgi:acetyl esterase/lipase